jgi:hypothetical protein
MVAVSDDGGTDGAGTGRAAPFAHPPTPSSTAAAAGATARRAVHPALGFVFTPGTLASRIDAGDPVMPAPPGATGATRVGKNASFGRFGGR